VTKNVHHANISSAIGLVISNPRLAPPHVTRNAAQDTRPSAHMWRVWAKD